MTTARRSLAVLGSPIGHSLSPTLHAAAYETLGLPFDYGRAEVESGSLAGFVDSLDPSWLGLSLTMPLKREVLPLLDTVSPLASRLGVANTVVFDAEGRRHGHNTDVDGIVRSVELRHDARPTAATILGGGATAASALFSAWRLGARSISIRLRDPRRAGDLTALAADLGVEVDVAPLDELASSEPLDFVVSTLPGGAADDLPIRPRDADSVLVDVAYEPWPTRLASRWADGGGIVLSGLDMLVEQALSQVLLFRAGATAGATATVGDDGDGDAPLDETRDAVRVREAMRRAVGLADRPTRASSTRASSTPVGGGTPS
ncbi:shikimate dehydrogenase [Frigoribacterium faeni]|uniref:Shikimate 5-dehydrogenase n=1 Tax=Frigoribacterium faeni TaxID=145483 RepID=A0A7W3JK90_9MICO|nr:shikimate dehydrogenase [Frigoribacterium faeni]MBA8814234.1 shikimate dehydrogenase [Frigoribacterium faeni]GEK83672.1 shikimate 5-dehydrogenase [Frigoribacterium faeni]